MLSRSQDLTVINEFALKQVNSEYTGKREDNETLSKKLESQKVELSLMEQTLKDTITSFNNLNEMLIKESAQAEKRLQ